MSHDEGLQERAPGFLVMDTLDRKVKGYAGGWLVQGRNECVIVDPGAGAAVPRWIEAFERAGIPFERVTWILLTHVHLDHGGGAGGLLHHFPNARIGIHQDGVRHLLNPERLLSQAKLAWSDDFHLLGPMVPAPAERVVALGDGDVIDVDGGRRLHVLHTPGHTQHHLAYFEETTRGVFPGDALGAIFGGEHPFGEFITIPGFSPPKGDLPVYLGSVRRIADLFPQRIYASHFGLWEPALPYIHAAAGEVWLLWEMCREVCVRGGTVEDAKHRMAVKLAAMRHSTTGQAELEKNFFAMVEAAWNFVVQDVPQGNFAQLVVK